MVLFGLGSPHSGFLAHVETAREGKESFLTTEYLAQGLAWPFLVALLDRRPLQK